MAPPDQKPSRAERLRRDAENNERARAQMMYADGQRSLGENIEQADALIRAAFEIAAAFTRRNG